MSEIKNVLTVIKHYQDLKIFDRDVANGDHERSLYSPPPVFGKIFHLETSKLAKKAAMTGLSSSSQKTAGNQVPPIQFKPFPK